jgi:hypothetical protein
VEIQKNLENAYIADMARYASSAETTRIIAAWSSIPVQLAKENHKFQYKVIKSGARSYEYEMPLQWLKNAGIIYRCVKIREGKLPHLIGTVFLPGTYPRIRANTPRK